MRRLMEFSVLGPLEVRAGGRPVELAGPKPRAVLAMLLLHEGEAVGEDRLAQALWGEDAPGSATKTVHVHVSRLRKALGAGVITTTPAGYVLDADGDLDLARFEALVAEGGAALDAGEAVAAGAALRRALALFRGPPLADLAAMPFAPAEIARLEEQRLAAIELRVEADLAAGRHAELVAELQHLTGEHRLRERLHAQLMLALYRSGRQADALVAYAHARDTLVEELGIEPGPELAELQRAVLAHEPALDVTPQAAHALPQPPNRTIGRDVELADIAERLATVRLLTLTGPGGVGKTRLALEAARVAAPAFAGGAWFVGLASTERAADVPGAIVSVLGVVVLSGESDAQALRRFVADKHLLLMLDNFEHVREAAPLVGELLDAGRRLTVLATSREPLELLAEQRYAVQPLTTGAETLFAERARSRDAHLEIGAVDAAVAEICLRVDGLPLAIELAAARCDLLTPSEIAERLDLALSLPGAAPRDAPARQRTLRATIDWSYELLDAGERRCFARFAVFAGGADVEAAVAITGGDLGMLERLVAKSLIVRRAQPGDRTRLYMLETIRSYAAERLAGAPDDEGIRERHYDHFLAVARRHGGERTLSRSGRAEHLSILDVETGNLRVALRWAIEHRDAGRALALTSELTWFWLGRSRYAEALEATDAVLALPGTDSHPRWLDSTLRARVWCMWPVGRGDEQAAVVAEIEELARRIGSPAVISEALATAADHASGTNRIERAGRLSADGLELAMESGDSWVIAAALRSRTRAARSSGELRELVDAATGPLEEAGNVLGLADLLATAAYVALVEGADADAREYAERALPVVRSLDDRFLMMILSGNRGLALLFTGDAAGARSCFRDEILLARELVVRPIAAEALDGLAAIAAAEGDVHRAAMLSGAAQSMGRDVQQDNVVARIEATFLTPARADPDAWEAAVREGAALGFEAAIASALG